MNNLIVIPLIVISFFGCGANVVQISDENVTTESSGSSSVQSDTTQTPTTTVKQDLKEVTQQLNGGANGENATESSENTATANEASDLNNTNTTTDTNQTVAPAPEPVKNVKPLENIAQTSSSVPTIPESIFELGK